MASNLPEGFVERTYIVVDSFKLDEYLKERFPNVDVSFAGDFEMSNDSCKVVNITDEPFDKYDQERFDKLIDIGMTGWGGPEYLMRHLCQEGVMPAGDYLVEVCW